jgi:ABC-type lipoprotein release transport system permease subunit
MGYKLLIHEFFENKKVIIRFLIIFTILFSAMSFQVINANNEIVASISQPDIVYTGTMYQSEDGKYPFIWYNDLGEGFEEYVDDTVKGEAAIYSAACRSLYNYYDEFTGIGFSGYVYGFDDAFIEEKLSPYIIEGKLPTVGEKEALVGAYFAERFGITVGDAIPQAITLSKQWDESDIDNYIVSGILNENVSAYFVGSAIISRETFENVRGKENNNFLIGYYRSQNEQRNRELFVEMNHTSSDYGVPEGRYNYSQKTFAKYQIYVASGILFIAGFAMISIMIAYIIKGIDRKIGLLKAIGLSTSSLMKYFVGGFSAVIGMAVALATVVISVATRVMNQYISNFYHFSVHTYMLNWNVLGLVAFVGASMVLIMCVLIRQKCVGISPQKAMSNR